MLSHLNERGEARMVDISTKEACFRKAQAEASLNIGDQGVFTALLQGALPKGDAFAVARLAGIQGAKQTSTLVPLCHPALPLDMVNVELDPDPQTLSVRIRVQVSATAKSGVEMEALTGAAAAALALYDVCKGGFKACTEIPHGTLCIQRITLLSKEKRKQYE